MKTNYQNAKIYVIEDYTTDMVYIGSTCKTLEQRLKQHERNFKAFQAGKSNNVTVFKILENDDYEIELVKNYPCATKQDLNIREGQIIKEYKSKKWNVVNRNIAGQTQSQYRQNNRNIINEKAKLRHNCCCGGKFSLCNKTNHEATKKHQNFINNSKTIINNGTLNITINLNNPEDLAKIDLLKNINK